MSFIYVRKSVGPRMLPWDTSLAIQNLSERHLRILAAYVILDKKALIHDNK
jgi:hypothetical protein